MVCISRATLVTLGHANVGQVCKFVFVYKIAESPATFYRMSVNCLNEIESNNITHEIKWLKQEGLRWRVNSAANMIKQRNKVLY